MNPQSIAADPAINAFVMANAGSGKTTTLVDRVARLLLAGSRPDAILCLTFTKAAAAEMQRRLYQRLGAWAVAGDAALQADLGKLEGRPAATYGADDLSRARALFARALETPGGLKIQTIHAFCEQLLRRFPVEAGVSPSFRVIDDVEAGAIAAVARQALARLSLDGAYPGLSDAYAAMSESLHHDAFEAMFGVFEARRAALADYVERSHGLEGLPDAVARSVGLSGAADLDAEVFEAAAADPARIDTESWMWVANVLGRAKAAGDKSRAGDIHAFVEATRSGGAGFDALAALVLTKDGSPATWVTRSAAVKAEPGLGDWLLREQARIVAAADQARAARVATETLHALTLAGVYAQAYEAAKTASGSLDFADLIVRARNLLTDGPGAAWVLYKLDGGVDHLLIDEAQDTSPEQWDIARALTEEFFAGSGARADGRERTVFVVGDEKQSIFSFQGAAPERLLAESQTYRRLAEGAGRRFETVELLQSWRSTAEVLELVDGVFASAENAQALSPGRGLIGDRADVIIRHAAGRDDGPGTIDIWPVERDDDSDERRAWDEPLDVAQRRGARRRVAERIVTEVRAIVEGGEGVHDKASPDRKGWRPADWGDVLILVKKRGAMFEEVLRALKRSGVPVAGADRLKLAEHPVFEDLLALGRAAMFPEDDLTLAGVLRSPLCDVDEQGLFDLAQSRSGSLWQALKTRADERPEWTEARILVRWMRKEAAARTPFDLFARLLNRRAARGLTVRQRFMTRLGGEAADALDAFLDQARAAEGRGVTDLERFCAVLAAIDQTVKREMDEPRGEVRVMTAHSSKGLEAPIVILPDTIFSEPKGDALLETEDGGFLWCGSSKRDCEASAAARELRKRRNEEESLRLLYVGLTRARDRLIVGGRVNARAKMESVRAWWSPIDTALAALKGVREVATASGPARRFGGEPRRLERAAATVSPPAAPPAWLTSEPARELAEGALSPSRMDGAARAAAPSPLATGGTPGAVLGRFRRGDLIHRLLERLPDIAPADRPDAARRLLARERDLDEVQREEMIAAAFAVLEDARFAPVFGPGSRPEVAITGVFGGVPVSGRMDRLVVTPDRVLVADYKTNRPAPDRAEDADPAYIRQMAVYVSVLGQLYPDRPVEAALVWTDGPRLTPVSQALMDAAIAAR
ncbi:double-strand break repair helicase AddA [Brevundimonas lenta]|uniref:DNA 3'-5' helicase n=1 Tax=Brevundimonas lenta TaxID=424796 RepID=A0A7W6JAQ6_9CAUL|nr:double-strand break repair helicase AddA [Brevundimonas lenta]MBB4081622.1 ATP-dependent helicase/nuclease subunit A [Brevundimonas lenta]